MGILLDQPILVTLGFDALDLMPEDFDPTSHRLTDFISQPDVFSFFVAYIAGTAASSPSQAPSRAH